MIRIARSSPEKEVMTAIIVLAAILLAAMVVIGTMVEVIGRMKEEASPLLPAIPEQADLVFSTRERCVPLPPKTIDIHAHPLRPCPDQASDGELRRIGSRSVGSDAERGTHRRSFPAHLFHSPVRIRRVDGLGRFKRR